MPVDLEWAQMLTEQCGRAPITVSGAWLPSRLDIEKLEDALGAMLSDKLSRLPPMGLKLVPEAYYRQYAGVFVAAEPTRRFVYINGIHENYVLMKPKNYVLRSRPVVVCGGGDWYFGALYDADTGEFSKFEFNRR